jgi:hypothetical protein
MMIGEKEGKKQGLSSKCFIMAGSVFIPKIKDDN